MKIIKNEKIYAIRYHDNSYYIYENKIKNSRVLMSIKKRIEKDNLSIELQTKGKEKIDNDRKDIGNIDITRYIEGDKILKREDIRDKKRNIKKIINIIEGKNEKIESRKDYEIIIALYRKLGINERMIRNIMCDETIDIIKKKYYLDAIRVNEKNVYRETSYEYQLKRMQKSFIKMVNKRIQVCKELETDRERRGYIVNRIFKLIVVYREIISDEEYKKFIEAVKNKIRREIKNISRYKIKSDNKYELMAKNNVYLKILMDKNK